MTRLVGLVPAAGLAKRLAPLPCSKEVFPVGYLAGGNRPKPIALYLLERMQLAGAERVLMIISREKWDIVRYFAGGAGFGMRLAYLIQENMLGMPYALDLAQPWLEDDELVLFGMPDTLFTPEDGFRRLVDEHLATGADLTLGLFPTDKPERFGMVAFDDQKRMLYTVDKPVSCDLRYMWGIGCWGSAFTRFMHETLGRWSETSGGREVVLGDVFQAAMEGGLAVSVLPFADGEYVDVGTLEDLAAIGRRLAR